MPVDPGVAIVQAPRSTAPPVRPPASRPVPLLQQNGFNGDIHDFNMRVQAVHDAHLRALGYAPSPALTLTVARNAEPHDYPGLFSRANRHQGMTQAALEAAGIAPTAPPTTLRSPNPDREQAQLLVKALGNVRTPDQLHAFLAPSNHEMIDAALAGPDSRLVQAAYVKAQKRAAATPQSAAQMGVSVNPGGLLSKAVGELALAGEQAATGLVLGPPTLAIAEGRAIGKAFSEGSLKPIAAVNVKLAKGVVQGVKRDVTHPKEEPGNLFLDALGFVSLGAGTVARVSAAGRALGEEGGLAAAKALARRPVGGTATLDKQGFAEEQLLTENPALRWAQRKLVNARNVRMAERGDEPAGVLSIALPQRIQDVIDLALDPIKANFSSENKLGREAKARRRIETTIQMTIKRDLDQVAGWTQTAATAFQRINKRLPERMRGLTVGEQKAIQVLATDDPDPFGAWRNFHENMIDLEVGDPAAHRAQLAALKLAEQVVADPRPRFVKALELTRQVILEQQQLKIDELGLSADTAGRRVIGMGEYVRQAGASGSKEDLAAVAKPGALGGPHIVDAPVADLVRLAQTSLPEKLTNVRGGTRVNLESDIAKSGRVEKPIEVAFDPKTGKAAILDGHHRLAAAAKHGFPTVPVRVLPIEKWRSTLSAPKTISVNSELGDLFANMKESNPTAFYLPSIPKGKPRRATSERLEAFGPQAGAGGIPIPTTPAELRHEITGAAIRAGDFRIDATSLAGETFARTVKAATKMNEWHRLWNAATDTPKSLRFDRPVRDIKDFPDELRGIVNKALDAELTGEEALSLHPADIQDLERFLFPGEFINGRWRLDKSIAHVKWVDSRLLDRYRQPLPRAFKTTAQILNEPIRDADLFLRPAYVLNLVGNVGMGLIDQGVLLPPNILRAVRLEATHGERIAKTIDALGGASGRSASYAAADVGEGISKILTTPGRVLARAWNTVTDQHLRRASIIYHLRRQLVALGKDPNDLESILFDPELAKARNEGVRRGNKAMVEFDNQTWLEREALRHLIFVYPWQSRALVWSIRTIVEHPAQAALLDQIGQQAEEEFPAFLQKAPQWFKEIGYVPLGTNADGTPKVVNPSSVNTFSTFSQLLYPLEAGFTSSKYSSLSDLFGPGATFLVHGATGKDQFGNTYPDGQWLGAAKEVWGQLPQLRAGHQKIGDQPKGLNLGDRNTLVTQLNSALKQTVFTPGWLNGYGGLIAGGLSPRGVNPQALEARWYRDLDFAGRHKVEMNLIHRALGLQADLVKQKLPAAVKEAVDLSGARQVAYDALKHQLGRTPTAKEQLQADIALFADKAKVNGDDAAVLLKKLGKITDPLELDRFRAGLYDKYANAKDLQQWDENVRFVFSFRPEILKGKLFALRAQGLVSAAKLPADQETLYAWGRKALQYRQQARARVRQIDDARGTTEESLLKAQLVAWADQHDQPVIVNGHTLPSPVRMEWANVTPKERDAHLAGLTKASWSSLSNFDKELVGRKVPASTSAAWVEVAQTIHNYKQQYPGSNIQREQLDGLAKIIGRDPRYAGFLADYTFSRQPRIARFTQTSLYKNMPERAAFDRIVGNDARKAAQAMTSGNYANSEIRAAWQKYVEEEVMPKIDKHPDLKRFLAPFGTPFLTGLPSR